MEISATKNIKKDSRKQKKKSYHCSKGLKCWKIKFMKKCETHKTFFIAFVSWIISC